jgi:hypothetical protein
VITANPVNFTGDLTFARPRAGLHGPAWLP